MSGFVIDTDFTSIKEHISNAYIIEFEDSGHFPDRNTSTK